MNPVARKVLEKMPNTGTRLAYGVMDSSTTVRIEDADTAVPVPQLASAGVLASGDYVALQIIGADALIIGKIGESGETSGSNANGNWYRFANGMQICELRDTQNLSITAAYGSVFIGAIAFTFPIAFVGVPAVAPGEAQWGTGASWASSYDVTATSCRIRYYDISSRVSQATPVSYTATGRWY